MPGPPDFLNLIGDRVDLIHAPALSEAPLSLSGKDYDCIVDGLDPLWPLRLRDPAVVQELHYDIPAWYWVCRASDRSVVAVDALDDPVGVSRYGFPTIEALRLGGAEAAGVVAAYLAAKRVRKRMGSKGEWERISELAVRQPDVFAVLMGRVFGSGIGRSLTATVLSGGPPDRSTLQRARRVQTARRMGHPRRTLLVVVGAIQRGVERVSRPTGLWVEIAGPDGTGKSTLASALIESTEGLFRRSRRAHWRPGVLGRRSAISPSKGDPTDPHGRAPRSRIASVPLVLFHWVDFMIGSLSVALPHRIRSGLWLQERGWWDLLVDQRRYRVDAPPAFVRALGSMLPKPDLLLVLNAPADVIAARQNEISIGEVERQSAVWREMDVPRKTEKRLLDALQPAGEVLRDAEEAVVRSLRRRTLRRMGDGWVALPFSTSTRWILPRGPRPVALAGLTVHQPMTPRGRSSWNVARTLAGLGFLKVLPRTDLPLDVLDLIAQHLPPFSVPAFAASNHAARWVVLVLARDGTPLRLFKVALEPEGRAALNRERAALERWGSELSSPIEAPRLVDFSDGVLVFDPVTVRPRKNVWALDPAVAAALGRFQAGSGEAAPVTHGDFAPWNLLLDEGGSWTLVDWEHASDDLPAFYDLWHWVVQCHSLLGVLSTQELLIAPFAGDTWTGRAFRAYADAAGADLDEAVPNLRSYLELSQARLIPGRVPADTGVSTRERLLQALDRQ